MFNRSSGNTDINEFIQKHEVIEWIFYERSEEVAYLEKGGFSKIYKAT